MRAPCAADDGMVVRLAAAEVELSAYRRALHERLDDATSELIARYREKPALALCALPPADRQRRRLTLLAVRAAGCGRLGPHRGLVEEDTRMDRSIEDEPVEGLGRSPLFAALEPAAQQELAGPDGRGAPPPRAVAVRRGRPG